MNAKRDLLSWSTLLYVAVLLASLALTARAGGTPPPGFDPGLLMILAQVLTILLPTLLFVWLAREPAAGMLNLRSLDAGTGFKSFLAGLLCWPAFVFLGTVGMILLGLLRPAGAASPAALTGQAGSPWVVFLGIILVAPLFEELLFRGVLLSVFQKRLASNAIWIVAILFAFLHPSLDQVLGSLFLGTVAGWVVYRTGSLWAGVLLHAGTNLVGGALTLMMSLAAPAAVEATAQTGDPGATLWLGALVWAVIGAIMLVPAFFLLRSIGRRHPASAVPAEALSLKSLWAPAAAVVGVVGYTVYTILQGA